jgi:hypothetical protein
MCLQGIATLLDTFKQQADSKAGTFNANRRTLLEWPARIQQSLQ